MTSTPTVERLLGIARAQIGYREGRANGHWNNIQKYSLLVPGLGWSQGMAWCATWASWVPLEAGAAALFPRTASCATGVKWFRDRGQFSEYPRVGSQIFFGAGGSTHTGLVESFTADTVTSIEGNTNTDGSAEGNGVYRQTRQRRSSYVYGYGHPAWPAPPSTTTGTTITVRAGQTLTGIAMAAGVSLAALLAANPSITNPDRIGIGQVLRLPAGSPPAGTGGGTPPTPPNVPPPVANPPQRLPVASNVVYGKRNDDVKVYQRALIGRGYAIPSGPTGYFGDETRSATREFQRIRPWLWDAGENGPDGVPGPLTIRWAILNR